ncbi:MAG: Fic family protein [Planctomycetota bacterium]
MKYDPARIGGYVPNETKWLPAQILERFESAAAGVMHQLDASTYSRQIAERFLIDLAWASSNLEGNTYNYLDTEVLVQYGEKAVGHELIEATMILNHKHALTELLANVDRPQWDVRFASRLHAMLMRDLISPEDLGRIRAHDVKIGASSYRPSTSHSELAEGLGSLLWKAEQTTNPFEASFFLMTGFSYLQAFADGNKRMGRVMSNVPLLAQGKPPMSFIGIDRANYLSGLIAFYEIGDLSLLAETVAAAYEQAAPSYTAAVATQRVPRSIDLRERQRIEEEIRHLIVERVDPKDAEPSIRNRFGDLAEVDQAAIVESITAILPKITPENAAAWGVGSEDAEAYRSHLVHRAMAPPG